MKDSVKNQQRPLFSMRIEVLNMYERSECIKKCEGRLPRPDEFLREDFKIPGVRHYRKGLLVVRLTEILKNRTLKSVDGLSITEDSEQFIRTSCQKKECFIHLDYILDTNSETWISEMVRYSIFSSSKLCVLHCNNLYFKSLPPKKLSQRTNIQIQSASEFMGEDTNIIKYAAYNMQHIYAEFMSLAYVSYFLSWS